MSFAAALAMASALLAGAGASAAPAAGAGSPGPPSLRDFYAEPALSRAQLSPSGRYLALAQTGAIGAVTVTDLETNKTTKVINLGSRGVATRGLSVNWLRWKGDRRLLIGLDLFDIRRNGSVILGGQTGAFVVVVDRDGENMHQLLADTVSAGQVGLLDALPNDPADVLLTSPITQRFSGVRKVNVVTGASEIIEVGDYDVTGWHGQQRRDRRARPRR